MAGVGVGRGLATLTSLQGARGRRLVLRASAAALARCRLPSAQLHGELCEGLLDSDALSLFSCFLFCFRRKNLNKKETARVCWMLMLRSISQFPHQLHTPPPHPTPPTITPLTNLPTHPPDPPTHPTPQQWDGVRAGACELYGVHSSPSMQHGCWAICCATGALAAACSQQAASKGPTAAAAAAAERRRRDRARGAWRAASDGYSGGWTSHCPQPSVPQPQHCCKA